MRVLRHFNTLFLQSFEIARTKAQLVVGSAPPRTSTTSGWPVTRPFEVQKFDKAELAVPRASEGGL